MKEGSFDSLLSDIDFVGASTSSRNATADFDVSQIKTPDEVPDAINLKNVPESVLRSGVIETLIQQNDDLLARLNVSLRRIALLEEKFSDSVTATEQFKTKYENLKDQLLVMREQSRLIADRAKESENRAKKEDADFDSLKEEIRLLEIRYAELYTTSSERESRIRDANEKMMRRLMRFEKYREGVRRSVPVIKSETRQLREKRAFYENQISDLRGNLSESTEYITQQSKQHKKDIADLTESYENSLAALQKEFAEANERNRALQLRADEADRFYQEKINIENDLIIAARREEDFRTQTAAEISDLQKGLARYRNEAKELALENERQAQLVTELKTSNASVKAENAALNEQIENLQILWREQQVQVEKFNEQKVALQKLNQELSQMINQYRRDIRDLKDKLEESNLKSSSAATTMRSALTATTVALNTSTVDATIFNDTAGNSALTGNATQAGDDEAAQLMSKIDKVLSNIHFGR